MNLTQYAIMTYRTTGVGSTVAEYFDRWAKTGEERPLTIREAERVLEFCGRVQKATPEILPGEEGEGNDLWCEANELAIEMGRFINAAKAETAAN